MQQTMQDYPTCIISLLIYIASHIVIYVTTIMYNDVRKSQLRIEICH